MRQTTIPGQLPAPRTADLTVSSATRPASIPASEWPDPAEERDRLKNGLPSRVVPEARFDANGNELPRYRATEPCYRDDVPGGRHDTGEMLYHGRIVLTDQECYHEGRPPYYLDPINEAAINMTMAHPPGEFVDPVESLPV